ncbi:MAG: phytase [Candidatus Bipolaricaulota bacterium]|nr:MAG: phytase [Candidatus Bipolaricaulota bacterium]
MEWLWTPRKAVVLLALAVALASLALSASADDAVIHRRLDLVFEGMSDTDDMCIWIHPTDASLSTIIAADKAADVIAVYDLGGVVLQTIELPRSDEEGSEQPGNIDVRYGFPLGDDTVDIVAFNQRASRRGLGFRIYSVDPDTRLLTRVDDGAALEHRNYGMCLYKSPLTGKFYAFATSKGDGVAQYELVDNGQGQITPVYVRGWDQRKCEGAVADDELGYVYICEEPTGVWRYDAEPDGSIEGTHVVIVGGEESFKKDTEGVTLYYAQDGGYLIVSSQGSDTFFVYDRHPPHAFVKSFQIIDVNDTDGIDVTNVALSDEFPFGIFTCHDDGRPSIALVVAYEDLGLEIDTSYDPRTGTYDAD